MFSRRLFTTSACLTLLAGCASAKTDHRSASLQAHCQALEAKAQGRLGVSIVDTATGQQWGWREDERFMMLSSFKLLASALVLHRVDQGQESLQRRMAYPRSALIPWSPITEKHADGPGLTLGELCAATITTSDNTAGNLILESYGGPAALTAYARQLGDAVTRLDRNERQRQPPLQRWVAGHDQPPCHGTDHAQALGGRGALNGIAPAVAAMVAGQHHRWQTSESGCACIVAGGR